MCVLLCLKKSRRRKQRNNLYQKRRAESNSEVSDLELEEGCTEEEEEEESSEEESKSPRTEAWRVPSIDLWIPTRQNPSGSRGELASVTVLSKGFDGNRKRKPVRGSLLVAGKDQAPGDLEPRTPLLVNVQAAEECALEDVKVRPGSSGSPTREAWPCLPAPCSVSTWLLSAPSAWSHL